MTTNERNGNEHPEIEKEESICREYINVTKEVVY